MRLSDSTNVPVFPQSTKFLSLYPIAFDKFMCSSCTGTIKIMLHGGGAVEGPKQCGIFWIFLEIYMDFFGDIRGRVQSLINIVFLCRKRIQST